jgi:hypothetical protein
MLDVGSQNIKVRYGAVEAMVASRQGRQVASQVPDEDLDAWMDELERGIKEWKIEVTAQRDDSLRMDVHNNDDG